MRDAGDSPSPRRAPPKQALCIGLSRFGDHEDEPPAGAYPDLPYAASRVTEVAAALAGLGYTCQTLSDEDLPTAGALGAAVHTAIGRTDAEAQVIHVLSHGRLERSGVYVVGADGGHAPETSVTSWLARIEDFAAQRRSHTLFLVDTCHAGAAARLNWLPAAGPDTRAWVIAATPGDSLAYDGRFSQAVASVLARIKAGDIDFYPSAYVPFGHVVEHIRREVVTLGGEGQYVTSTPVDGNPAPPFFLNPRPPLSPAAPDTWADLDAATQPFTELDPALDAAHFLDRAKGHGGLGSGAPIGCFTGREHELQAVTAWLDDPRAGGLRIITGGPGSGKSALLGLLVCAAHPGLRDRTRHLWEHVHAAPSHSLADLAAVHLRERNLADTLVSLTRQLVAPVPVPKGEMTVRAIHDDDRLEIQVVPDAAELVAAITAREHPPVIVFDALDEAQTQSALLRELLMPLATATRLDGRPACRLLVGMRPWEQFAALRDLAGQAGAVTDLDEVPTDRLRGELKQYIGDLLDLTPGYSRPADLPVRRSIALDAAYSLTEPGRERGGEFLAAGLFVNWILTRRPDDATAAEAAELTHRVPRDVRDLLELDLDSHADQPWFRPILLTLAQARGAGMPATVIRRLAPLCRDYADPSEARGELTVAEFDEALRQVRFYLRSSADTDGTTLYRLFHQGLVEQLREEDVDLGGLVAALLATAPPGPDGRRRWDAAEPYVQRHAVQHAADAGRLDVLLLAEPEQRESALSSVTTPLGRATAAICAPQTGDVTQPGRRDLMAIEALRYGYPRLAARLADVPGLPGHHWWPAWATGEALASIPLAKLPGPSVSAMACARLRGRSVTVTTGSDGLLRVWDMLTGQPVGAPVTVGSHHQAVACTWIDDRAVAVTGAFAGQVLVWDLATGHVVGSPITILGRGLCTIACTHVDGRAVACVGSVDGQISFWDLADGSPFGTRPSFGHGGGEPSLACTRVADRPVAVSGSGRGPAQVWDMLTGRPLHTLGRRDPRAVRKGGAVQAVACCELNGRPVVVIGTDDGTVRFWNPASGREAGEPAFGHSGRVEAVACAVADGRTVAVTGGVDGSVRVWDVASRTPIGKPLATRMGRVTSVACAEAGGRVLAVAAFDFRNAAVWDLGEHLTTGGVLSGRHAAVTAVTGGQDVVVSGGHRTLETRDLATGQLVGAPASTDAPVARLDSAMISGRRVAVLFAGGPSGGASTIRIVGLESPRKRMDGQIRLRGDVHAVACTTVNGSPVVVTVNHPVQRLGVWNLSNGRLHWALPLGALGLGLMPSCVACAHLDGRPIMIIAGHRQKVQVRDLATGDAIGELIPGDRDLVHHLVPVSIMGRPSVVSVDTKDRIRVWDLASRQLRHELDLPPGPEPELSALGCRPVEAIACGLVGGRSLAVTGGSDAVLRVWDLFDGALAEEFVFPEAISAVSLTEDGDILVGFGWEVAVLRRAPSGKAVP
jgi:WD40 repeat protein